jgi:hypothetical protein
MKHIVIATLYLLFLLGLSEFVFDPTYLYYELPWLDIPMHIMGGFGVAFFTSSVLSYAGIKVSFVKICIAYLIVAISWELSEFIRDTMAIAEWNGWQDTTADVVDGFIGMSIAYFFIKK